MNAIGSAPLTPLRPAALASASTPLSSAAPEGPRDVYGKNITNFSTGADKAGLWVSRASGATVGGLLAFPLGGVISGLVAGSASAGLIGGVVCGAVGAVAGAAVGQGINRFASKVGGWTERQLGGPGHVGSALGSAVAAGALMSSPLVPFVGVKAALAVMAVGGLVSMVRE